VFFCTDLPASHGIPALFGLYGVEWSGFPSLSLDCSWKGLFRLSLLLPVFQTSMSDFGSTTVGLPGDRVLPAWFLFVAHSSFFLYVWPQFSCRTFSLFNNFFLVDGPEPFFTGRFRPQCNLSYVHEIWPRYLSPPPPLRVFSLLGGI